VADAADDRARAVCFEHGIGIGTIEPGLRDHHGWQVLAPLQRLDPAHLA
jgi:hypothetical protein